MKKLLLLPLALMIATPAIADDTLKVCMDGQHYLADKFDAEKETNISLNAKVSILTEQNVDLKAQVEAKDAKLLQSFRTNESISQELAQTTEWLNNCNYGNFVALQKLDTVTAEKEALETANEELQENLSDILALASHFDINNPGDMATILEAIQTIAGGE